MVKSCKTLNLISGILEIIFSAFMMAMGVLFALAAFILQDLFVKLSDALPVTGAIGAMIHSILGIIFLVIALVYGITYIIFGIKTVKCAKLDEKKYIDKKWLFLSFSIVETVLTGLMVYTLITNFSIIVLILAIVCMLILIMRYAAFGLLVRKAKVVAAKTKEQKELPAKPEAEILLEPEQTTEESKNNL